ncbi:MAG: sugar phosphate isomerase/epimerase family protein [Candidatus Nanopelagicus sp.]|jgi:D-psicose/D-tagatose/L-ribulose 3-epimerase
MTTIPNLLGVHALVWVGGWSKDQCREAIKNSAEAGYGLIEIPALDPKSIDVEHTKATLKEFGLKGACSLGLSFDADINNDDSEIAKRGEARLMDALNVVEQLGGDYLGGVIFSALGKYKFPPTKKARDNAVAALKRLAIAAQAKGITLGLEPVNRYESNLLNTGSQALDMIKDIGEPNVVVHLDIYHMNIEEQDLVSPVLEAGNKLGYVHIGASHRGPLGTGNIDFDSFFGALAKIGYKGTITFESFSSTVVAPDLSSTLGIWRNLWTDNKSMAKSAREYIENKIVAAHKN